MAKKKHFFQIIKEEEEKHQQESEQEAVIKNSGKVSIVLKTSVEKENFHLAIHFFVAAIIILGSFQLLLYLDFHKVTSTFLLVIVIEATRTWLPFQRVVHVLEMVEIFPSFGIQLTTFYNIDPTAAKGNFEEKAITSHFSLEDVVNVGNFAKTKTVAFYASHEIASAAVVECYLHCKIITCLILCMKDKTKKNIVLYENTLPQDARVLFETFEQIDLNLNLVEIL